MAEGYAEGTRVILTGGHVVEALGWTGTCTGVVVPPNFPALTRDGSSMGFSKYALQIVDWDNGETLGTPPSWLSPLENPDKEPSVEEDTLTTD